MSTTIKIDNKTIATIFAGYFGQETTMGTLYKISFDTAYCHGDVSGMVPRELSETKLILKPIDQISDEDALRVSELFGGASHLSPESQIFQAKQVLSSPNFYVMVTNISGARWLKVFQYLQSKGYDLPHYLLDGKTLQEAGLAIYE